MKAHKRLKTRKAIIAAKREQHRVDKINKEQSDLSFWALDTHWPKEGLIGVKDSTGANYRDRIGHLENTMVVIDEINNFDLPAAAYVSYIAQKKHSKTIDAITKYETLTKDIIK